MMQALHSDLRHAWLYLWRRPGFALTSLAVLAIGVGAVTVMFSTLYAVVLRPLPYDAPERLVWVWGTTENRNSNTLSALDYFDYREHDDAFASLAAHLFMTPGRIVTSSGDPQRVTSTIVSANLFETLGVPPQYGRSFALEEEVQGGPNVVIASHGYLQRMFGGDPNALGAIVTVDGESFELVGVMPQGFDYPEGVELWFPMQRGGDWESSRGNRNFNVLGRLLPGISIEQAQLFMNSAAAELAETYTENREWSVRLEPLHERFVAGARPAMWILMGGVTLLLLIACANLSSLIMANVTSRTSELIVRVSLGASRGALVRQLLVESLLITFAGAGLGSLLAALGIELVRSLGPGDVWGLQRVELDAVVFAVSVAVSVVSGLLATMVPALRAIRVGTGSAGRARRSTETRGSLRLRGLLVAAQTALCLTLLVGSGLLLRSLVRLQQVDPGFAPEGVLTLDVQLPSFRYDMPETVVGFFADAIERIRAIPSVSNASAVSQFPLGANLWNYVHRADRPPRDPSERLGATRRRAMDGYFETIRVPLLAGRTFDTTDRLGSQPVVVVSRVLAGQLFSDESPLGKTLVLPGWGDAGVDLAIVGVVGDLRDRGLAAEHFPVFYLAARQFPSDFMRVAVRTVSEPAAMASTVRGVFRELDPEVPAFNFGTLQAQVFGSTSTARFQTVLAGAFAAIALVLASIGLYGVLAYFVGQRTRELGIRMALGASGSRVMAEVVEQGAVLVGAGMLVGLAGGAIASRFLQGLLFEISPTDSLTYVVVTLTLALVTLAASVIPARRAVRIDPVTALRAE